MQWLKMTKNTVLAVSVALVLSACASRDSLPKPSAAEKASNLADIKVDLSIALMDDGNSRAALATIDEALAASSNNIRAWMIKGQIEQSLKMNDKAGASFQRALSLDPNSAEVNNAYGWFLCNELKQPRESIQYFDKALSDPTYPAPFFAYYNKGVCYNKMDNPYQGKEYLMRALNVERSYYPAKREIARIDLGLGEVSSALQMFGEYQSQVDNMEAGDLLLGWKIARAAGHTQAAYEYEMQLQTSYPYSDELREIKTGK